MTGLGALLSSEEFWVAVSAVIAAVSLAVSAWDKRKLQVAEEVRQWQAVVVQTILQPHTTKAMSFDDLLQRYRSEATSFAGVAGKAALVSREELRRVLLALIRDGIVWQAGSDQYYLGYYHGKTPDDMSADLEKFRAGLFGEDLFASLRTVLPTDFLDGVASDNKVKRSVYALLGSEPFRHTSTETALVRTERFGLRSEDVRAFIATGLAKKEITQDQHGRLGIGDSPVISGASVS